MIEADNACDRRMMAMVVEVIEHCYQDSKVKYYVIDVMAMVIDIGIGLKL